MVLAHIMPTISQEIETLDSQRTCDIIRTAILSFKVQISEQNSRDV